MNKDLDLDALIESEKKFRLLAENSIDCIWTMDKNLNFTYLSPSLEQLFGAKPEEWIGTKLSTHLKKKDFLIAGGHAMRALKNYKDFTGITFETKMLNNENKEINVEITGKVAKDNEGRLIGLQGSTRVITEQKKNRNELVESRRLLSTLMHNLPGMVYRCHDDEHWTMEFISDGCLKLTGYKASELISNRKTSYSDLVHPDDIQMVKDCITKTINDEDFIFTYRIITKSGIEKWVFERGQRSPEKDESPMLEGFIIDISDQKRIEKELIQSLAEKDILLSEIHHRVKNNLQLIISLLEIQKPDLPEQFKSILNDIIMRVKIFADIHQDLYQSDTFMEIDIAKHIKSIFDNIFQANSDIRNKIDLKLNIPHPFFSLGNAIHIGLLINELISNSYKYGFDADQREISITINCSENDIINEIIYFDIDSAKNIDKADFGSILLNAMAAQLNLKMAASKSTPGKYYFS